MRTGSLTKNSESSIMNTAEKVQTQLRMPLCIKFVDSGGGGHTFFICVI